MGLIKYETLKPAAHTARSPQVLALDFNYAEVLIKTKYQNNWESESKP